MCVCVCLLGRSAAHRVLDRYKARTQDQTTLNRGLSRSMGSLPTHDGPDEPLHPDPLSSDTLSERLPPSFERPSSGDRSMPQPSRKTWVSSVDLAYLDPDALRFGALEDARRGSSALSTRSAGRVKSGSRAQGSQYSSFGSLEGKRVHHHSAGGAYDKFLEQHRKLHVLTQAIDGECSY